jgi:hypothetical protein
MDNVPDSVREIINNYLKALEAHHIRIRKVVLFGSYVTGKADEWSVSILRWCRTILKETGLKIAIE